MWVLTSLLWVSLISIPDSSPRACGGVEYSFEGFFRRKDSEGLDLPSRPAGCLGGVAVPFYRDRAHESMQVRDLGCRKGFLLIPILPQDSIDPPLSCDRIFGLLASPSSLEPPRVAGVQSRG